MSDVGPGEEQKARHKEELALAEPDLYMRGRNRVSEARAGRIADLEGSR